MGGVNQEDGLELATEGHEGPGHLGPKVSGFLGIFYFNRNVSSVSSSQKMPTTANPG